MESNPYSTGSLLWVERNNYRQVRQILEMVISGALTIQEAKSELHALDTDTAS